MELISLVALFFMGLLLVIALYTLVKKAVKDALREYDAEKEKPRSGPQS